MWFELNPALAGFFLVQDWFRFEKNAPQGAGQIRGRNKFKRCRCVKLQGKFFIWDRLRAQVVATFIVQCHIETFGLFVFINPKPHYTVENLKEYETDNPGIHDGGNNAGGLSQ